MLKKVVVEKCRRRALEMLDCREVLEKSVAEKCGGRLLRRCWRRVLQISVGEG